MNQQSSSSTPRGVTFRRATSTRSSRAPYTRSKTPQKHVKFTFPVAIDTKSTESKHVDIKTPKTPTIKRRNNRKEANNRINILPRSKSIAKLKRRPRNQSDVRREVMDKYKKVDDEIYDDIIFKFKLQKANMVYCDNVHFLYVAMVVIDEINAEIKRSKPDIKVLYNKSMILSRLRSIKMDGISFMRSRDSFIEQTKQIVFHTQINNDHFITRRLKQQYAYDLYERIVKFDLQPFISRNKSCECLVSFRPSFSGDSSLRKSSVSVISTLDQYDGIYTNTIKNEEKRKVTDVLNECNDKISFILSKQWTDCMKNKEDVWKHTIISIEQCSVLNVLYALDCILNYKLDCIASKTKHNIIFLHQYASKIQHCFEENNVNGSKLKSMQEDEAIKQLFLKQLNDFVDSESVLKAHEKKHFDVLYEILVNINVFAITALYIKNNLKWNESIKSIKECKQQEVLYIVLHLLSQPSLTELRADQDHITAYFVRNQINGSIFDHFKEQIFVDRMYKFLKFKHKSSLTKLYYAIKRCPMHDVIDFSLEYHTKSKDKDGFMKWNQRTSFKNIKRVGYKWDDGVIGYHVIVVADIISHVADKNQRIQLHVKHGVNHRTEPFWLTLPSDKLCKPSQHIIQQSHHDVFNKWMRIFRIKHTLKSPFEENVFRDMARLSQMHPRLIFTVRHNNYAVPLQDKTRNHLLHSLFAYSLASLCRKSRCFGKPKLDCYCNTNGFQKYTYEMMMAILSQTSASISKRRLDSMLSTLSTESDHLLICGKLCEFLPSKLQENKSYFKAYKKHIQQWLLHDFYNIICSHCGNVHKSIMINRVFHYSSTLKNCRTCGVIVRVKEEFEDDDITERVLTPRKMAAISWFCKKYKTDLMKQGIKVTSLKKALSECTFIDSISINHKENDLLNLLLSFLEQQFDELTYYLSRFLDDMDSWKQLRIKIATNYYCYEYRKSFVNVRILMKEVGIHQQHKNIFKDCWNRALFQSTKENQQLIHLLDDHKEEEDALCTDLKRLQLLRKLIPSISVFATKYIKSLKTRFPNTKMDIYSLIQLFLNFKIDDDTFPIMIFNRWKYLRSPASLSYTNNSDCIFIQPLHDSLHSELKQELGIDIVEDAKYSKICQKAEQIFNGLQKTSDNTLNHIHIQAVLLFIAVPTLRDAIRRLWTQISVIDLHHRFANLFKLLKEMISKYGSSLKSDKQIYYDINEEMLCDKWRSTVNIPILCSNKPGAFKKKSNQFMAECCSVKPLHVLNVSTFIASSSDQEFYIFFGGTCEIRDKLHIDHQQLDADQYSKCEIYSNSQQKWIDAKIAKVFRNETGEWLEVECDKDNYKHVQRLDDKLRAAQCDKWCAHMTQVQYTEIDDFFMRLITSTPNILDECCIPFNAELMFRMKTILRYYKKSQNIIPDFAVFREETNLILSDDYRESFRTQYTDIKQQTMEKHHRRSMKTISDNLLRQKPERNISDNKRYDVGIFMRYDVNNPRFESLAEEIMFNEVVNISTERFNQYLLKAKEIHAENSLIMLSTANDVNFGIEKWQPICISHIVSIIIHTEEPQYSRAFTLSCLDLNQSDSEAIIQHHCNNFYWFGRYIFECIEYFGQILDDHESSTNKQGRTQLFKFDLFSPPIHFPRSTTKSMHMALHYTADTGGVLELIPKYYGVLNSTKFIDLSTMTPDYDADTRLFFGRRSAIQINNIWLSNAHSLRKLILPLLYFEKIMLQTIFDRQFLNAKHLYDKKGQQSEIQATLYNMLQTCMAIHLFQRANTHLPKYQIADKDTQLLIIKRYFPKIHPQEHDEMLYVVDLLKHWCLQRTFITFESFRAEIAFMIQPLKKLFLWHDIAANVDYIRIEKLCLIMPNLKHYRNFDKQVIAVYHKKSRRLTAMLQYDGIIDIINDNLRYFYEFNHCFAYNDKFRTWCNENQLDNDYVAKQLKPQEFYDTKLLQFDDDFPDSRLDGDEVIISELDAKFDEDQESEFDPHNDQDAYIRNILQIAAKPNLLKILYPRSKYLKALMPKIDVDETQSNAYVKKSQSRQTMVITPRISLNNSNHEQKSDDYDAIYRVLSNCQIHELPNEICKILEKLGYHFDVQADKRHDSANILTLSPSQTTASSLFAYPKKERFTPLQLNANAYAFAVETDKHRKLHDAIFDWKLKHLDELKSFYDAISKQQQASKEDFVKIAQNTGLFDKYMIDKLSEELMDRLFTDIERMKPWKCNVCWFINRKMMIGGLWCLYNQLNECGLCGVERDHDEEDEIFRSARAKTYHAQIPYDHMQDTEIKEEWENDADPQQHKICSITSKNAKTINMYVEQFTIERMNEFIAKYLSNNKALSVYKEPIIQYFTAHKLNGTTFLHTTRKSTVTDIDDILDGNKLMVKLSLFYKEIIDHLRQNTMICKPMKRITFILKQYHLWTDDLHTNNNNERYPYSIRQFLAKCGRTQLLDDFKHITKHSKSIKKIKQPYITPCDKGTKCVHQKRVKQYKQNLSDAQKQRLLNCEDGYDFEYICYLDKIHCFLFHDMNVKYEKEQEIIRRYSDFAVYATGVYMDHSSLGSLHVNLKQEYLHNTVYNMNENDWKLDIKTAQNILSTKWKNAKKPIARETNEIYGIKIGDEIQIEHVLVVYLYTSRTLLCTQFRKSYRSNEYEDNPQNIRSHHINNFYWMGRFIFCAIQFFGEKPKKDEIFYHGLRNQFLFTQFSTIFEIPTSTSKTKAIAQRSFAQDQGIVLSLGPKFKNELNNNKYLNVTSISSYGTEDERLFAGMTVLAVVDIEYWVGFGKKTQYVSLGKSAQVFLYFERIVEQTIHNKNYYNYGFVTKKDQRTYLLPLLKHQMHRNGYKLTDDKAKKEIDDKRQYLYALFQHFCDSKRDYINLTCINDEVANMDESIQQILFKMNMNSTAKKQLEINNENLRYIFPKLKGYKNHWCYWIKFAS